jgi:hypothetical protein
MFILALFSIAKLWNQPRCPSTDEYIKNIWHRDTMEYHLPIKKNEIMSTARKWMEPEVSILS